MVRIVVTSEQARQLGESPDPIELVDEHGNHLGYFTQPFSRSEILEAKRRSESESGGRTTAEVLDRLANRDDR